MTQAEFAALDPRFKSSVSSHITYGSSTDTRQHHVYFCPTVWCSESRTPMSYQQYVDAGNKCPDGKAGIQLWEEGDKKRKLSNVGFYGKSIEGAEPCLPCCYSRALNELNKGKCMKKVLGSPVVEQTQTQMAKPSRSKTQTQTQTQTAVAPTIEDGGEEGGVDGDVHEVLAASATPAQAQSQAQSQAAQANGKDYLLTHAAPLPKDRWGTLPRSLHMVLHPSNLLQSQCTQQLTSKPCLLRRGILHHSDSFMQALGYIFTGKTNSKGDLLRLLRETITPEVFVTLENGLVLAAFAIEDTGIVPTSSSCKKWLAWMATPECKKYKKLFGLADVVSAALAGRYASHRLSRELAVHKAFIRFHAYLASSEAKDASLLVDAVRHLGVQLVLWEKDAADSSVVRMRCPSAVPYSALGSAAGTADAGPLVGMLLQEKGVFEPIELGSKSAIIGRPTMHTPTAALKKMMTECDAGIVTGAPETRAWVETVRSIDAAARLVLGRPEYYTWQHVVISPDYAIVGLINAAGYVPCGRVPICGLMDLCEALPGIQVKYQEDLGASDTAGVAAGASSPQDDAVFATLLRTFGIAGIAAFGTGSGQVIDAPPIIATRVDGELKNVQDRAKEAAAAWRSTKWLVGRELMKHYDTRVVPFIGDNKKKAFVEANIGAFPAAAKYVEDALNEVAGLLSAQKIADWMTSTDRDAWPFLSSNIINNGAHARAHEWLFSQLAVERGLPAHVVKPVDGARPRTYVRRVDGVFEISWPNKVARMGKPALNNTESVKLPWKWEAARRYSWRDWAIEVGADGGAYMKKWMDWAAAERGIPFKWTMAEFAAKVYVANVVAPGDDSVAAFLKHPGMTEVVKGVAGWPKSMSASKVVSGMLEKSVQERRVILGECVGKIITDTDWDLVARSSGITVLIVANVDYAKADKDSPILCADFRPTVDKEDDLEVCSDGPSVTAHARGSTKDLITNATLLYDGNGSSREALWRRPFVMLYKHVTSASASARYAPVGQGVWASLRHCPKDLQHVACCLWKHKESRR